MMTRDIVLKEANPLVKSINTIIYKKILIFMPMRYN